MDFVLESIVLHLRENKKKITKLSDMRDLFSDEEAVSETLRHHNPVIYEVYIHESDGRGALSYALTRLYPGDIAGEYYMTKGHFHEREVGEVYIGLSGRGLVLMQNREGDTKKDLLSPGSIIHVPSTYGHRTVNTGSEDLVFLSVYPSNAGHDYSLGRTAFPTVRKTAKSTDL